MSELAVTLESSVDPLTGEFVHTSAVSGPLDVDAVVAAALDAAPLVATTPPAQRAGWLEAVADAVTARAEELAALADRETGLGRARLDGEVLRCAAQLRFYAAVARDGGFLDVVVDHATDTAPDLRRMRVPLGPVAVFGASNFPFAFGTLGNDTGSALAAGCPVVVKGHPAHLGTHALLLDIAVAALREAGAPEGTLGGVTGFHAGSALVVHPWVRAVAFTGSQRGGMALAGLAATRPIGIPVYAEMGTINPVVVTREAAAARAATVGAGAVQSFTLGMGQFCTKPGLILTPRGSAVTGEIIDALARHEPRGPMLTTGIATAYVAGIDRLIAAGAHLAHVVPDPGPGTSVSAVVMTAEADQLVPGSPLVEECFGPVIVVAEYDDDAHRDAVLARLQGCLVACIMTNGPEDPEIPGLVGALTTLAGRVVVDGWPTGVSTTWAQQHGGPWPSTTAPSATSVGSAALDRFTRPVAYQGISGPGLPEALREGDPWRIPRRIDGVLQVPSLSAAPSAQERAAAATDGGHAPAKRARSAAAAKKAVTAKVSPREQSARTRGASTTKSTPKGATKQATTGQATTKQGTSKQGTAKSSAKSPAKRAAKSTAAHPTGAATRTTTESEAKEQAVGLSSPEADARTGSSTPRAGRRTP